jgi:threonine aldolase
MAPINRRLFLKSSSLSMFPLFVPPVHTIAKETQIFNMPPAEPFVKFFFDGETFAPPAYINQLQQINTAKPIEQDSYGIGGPITALEKKFEEITGKQRAIFMPTGTMANQLAIAVLSGENTKVFVQETSHVYRDEADAAQSVFNKRLIPLAQGKTFFTTEELEQAVDYHNRGEVFKSGIGTISIENPVRRTDGRMVPIEEIRNISAYCRKNNFKLHLDGARIYMASAWSGIPVKEYASYFDTIYISLYKYLGASAGAVLCGDKSVIDKMEHLIKIHGGSMYGNWANAAMALHRLEGIESRLQKTIKNSVEIFTSLNKLPDIKINQLDGGTNIYMLKLSSSVNGKKMREILAEQGILMGNPNNNNEIRITVNETLLHKDNKVIIDSFKNALKSATG